jgi:hypothetical protein
MSGSANSTAEAIAILRDLDGYAVNIAIDSLEAEIERRDADIRHLIERARLRDDDCLKAEAEIERLQGQVVTLLRERTALEQREFALLNPSERGDAAPQATSRGDAPAREPQSHESPAPNTPEGITIRRGLERYLDVDAAYQAHRAVDSLEAEIERLTKAGYALEKRADKMVYDLNNENERLRAVVDVVKAYVELDDNPLVAAALADLEEPGETIAGVLKTDLHKPLEMPGYGSSI